MQDKQLDNHIDELLKSASSAFETMRSFSMNDRADLLRNMAREIGQPGDELIRTVMEETHLPQARVKGELTRTIGQIEKFADMLTEGSWVEAIIDTADAARTPAPRPDVRKMLVPLGPVVVFGAGNFPLAFSVGGGDTASALAAGNPVIVKGHPAHPRTGAWVASAIRRAVASSGFPEATFQLTAAESYDAGRLLVVHPLTKAGSFTGSLQGGRALTELANSRSEPIPFFAEMGSVNPVIIFPEALQNKPAQLAAKLIGSVNLNAGQFCTSPGLVITVRDKGFNELTGELSRQINAAAAEEMFSKQVFSNFIEKSEGMLKNPAVSLLGKGSTADPQYGALPVLALTDGASFISDPSLQEEVFGPFSLVVGCDSPQQMEEVIRTLKGQLTITVQAESHELAAQRELLAALAAKCGRLILNGVPTGVEVCAAMQHGGPYPASSDPRFTSVGVSSVKRFARPLCYQDFPDHLLPAELQNSNPLSIFRKVNNRWTRDKIMSE